MTSSTLPALPSASALGGSELIYGVQSGVDSKITATQIDQYVNSQFSGDATVNSAGVVTCTKTASNPFGVLATATVPLSTANGGTGTAAPGLVPGSNITITGSWPNQTIASTLTNPTISLAHGGRLTLQSATPVMISSTVSGSTLYYAPYNSPYIAIYNGSVIANYQFTSSLADSVGLSLGTFGSGWAITSMYDVFITLNGGVPVLGTGPAWSSAGSSGNPTGTPGVRAAAGSIGMCYGQLVNSNAAGMTLRIGNATTISVPQYQATWVGTILTDGAGQLDFIFGSEASGGSPSYLYVWNKYNQVPTAAINFDTGPTYTYSTATTRVARNSASNAIYFITGEVANSLQVQSQSFVKTVGAYPCYSIVGWGVNTTATSGTVALFAASVVYGGGSGLTLAGAQALMFSAAADNYYQLGFNTIYRFELGDGTDANTMDAIGQDLLNSEYLM